MPVRDTEAARGVLLVATTALLLTASAPAEALVPKFRTKEDEQRRFESANAKLEALFDKQTSQQAKSQVAAAPVRPQAFHVPPLTYQKCSLMPVPGDA
jgi:hypothetical protein